jgi:uncharacterized membrane protein YkoI
MKILIYLLIIIALSQACHAGDSIDIARISLHEATQKILSDGNKRVLAATTEIIDGREVHVIKVLTPDGRILHYKIDAETGATVS